MGYAPQTAAEAGKLGSIPLAGLSGLNGLGGFNAGGLSHAALAALTGHQNRPQSSQQTHEMTVPNELIGCIIGKGGSKVAEIRQLSGAMIRISNCEDRDAPANLDRTITITGNAESVALAQYLINMSMEVFRANLHLLEEQQLTAVQAAAVTPTVSASLGLNTMATSPRLLLTDSTYPGLGQEMAAPAAAPAPQPQTQVYAIASNFTNNNTLQYPACNMQQQLIKPYSAVTSCVGPAELTQTSYMYQPVSAVPAVQPRPMSTAPAAGQVTGQVVISNKLKASPTLISLPSARDHKFMPY